MTVTCGMVDGVGHGLLLCADSGQGEAAPAQANHRAALHNQGGHYSANNLSKKKHRRWIDEKYVIWILNHGEEDYLRCYVPKLTDQY